MNWRASVLLLCALLSACESEYDSSQDIVCSDKGHAYVQFAGRNGSFLGPDARYDHLCKREKPHAEAP